METGQFTKSTLPHFECSANSKTVDEGDGGSRRTAQCVRGRTASAHGPASACRTKPIVADILRVPFSTFASSFTAVCMRSSHFWDRDTCLDVMRRAKTSRWPAKVNQSRPIAAFGFSTTIAIFRRGPGGGYGGRGSQELFVQETMGSGGKRRDQPMAVKL